MCCFHFSSHAPIIRHVLLPLLLTRTHHDTWAASTSFNFSEWHWHQCTHNPGWALDEHVWNNAHLFIYWCNRRWSAAQEQLRKGDSLKFSARNETQTYSKPSITEYSSATSLRLCVIVQRQDSLANQALIYNRKKIYLLW